VTPLPGHTGGRQRHGQPESRINDIGLGHALRRQVLHHCAQLSVRVGFIHMALFSLTGRSGGRNSIPMLARMQRASEYLHKGLGQFPRRRGGGWVRQIALTSFLPGAVVIDFPDDLCAAA
jgi:hypothetical protein